MRDDAFSLRLERGMYFKFWERYLARFGNNGAAEYQVQGAFCEYLRTGKLPEWVGGTD